MRRVSTPAIAALAAALVFTIATVSSVHADLADGVSAYDGGDYETAIAEFTAAAQAGDPGAQLALANMMQYGEGMQRDTASAAVWYRLAAERGDAVAQINLAELTRTGTGPEADPEGAYFWLSLAVRSGHRWAIAALPDYKRDLNLDAAALKRIDRRLANWRPFVAVDPVSGPAEVQDAATLSIASQSFRLTGIDVLAPGTRCMVRGNEHDCGHISSTALMDIVIGATVRCEPQVLSAKDGTRTAYCEADGYDLSFGMIYAGWATAAGDAIAHYQETERRARQAHRGLWHE